MVLAAAALTLVGWRIATGTWASGMHPALGVLVVACPCPLVLATPCAVMASLAWLARRGVIVKGSAVLERLATVDTFAFDKTGTLTQGALELGEIVPTTGLTRDDVLRVAAIAERHSEHLLARILVRSAEERGLAIPASLEFKAIAGAGVTAKVPIAELRLSAEDLSSSDDVRADQATRPAIEPLRLATIVVGNRRALHGAEIAFSHDAAELLKVREAAGESPLVVALDGTVIGVIGVRESIRPESRRVLNELRAEGISQFALLTGDRSQPADAVVRSLGLFEHVATDQLPADKAEWVETARQAGRQIAMVGDGINDAPALAAANVGLAIGRAGGDLAAAAGDIILLGDPLHPLPGLVRLSRALVQNIWQSIVIFAFGLNGLGVLACSLRWLDPIGAAVFHEIASLAVMANAMRLLAFENWSSSFVSRAMQQLVSAVDWVVLNASPTSWIYWGIDRWQLGLKLTAALMCAAWFLSGVVLLRDDEQAIVTRLGRYEATLSSGPHWRWPWPLERTLREKTNRIRSVAVGFRNADDTTRSTSSSSRNRASNRGVRDDGKRSEFSRLFWRSTEPKTVAPSLPIVEWTSSHDENSTTDMAEESLMLTADEVPVELRAEVQYVIRDLKQFLFAGSRQPDAVLRAAAESVLREIAGTASIDALLTEGRANLERQSLARLKQRVEQYSIGVEVIELQWLDVHPPQAVVPSYRQVADALEEQELLINEAEAYASRTLVSAIGEEAYSHLQSAAKSQSPEVRNSSSRIDWDLTNELWRELQQQNANGDTRLSGNSAAILLEGHTARTRREQAAIGVATRFNELLAEYRQQPGMTRRSLYWTAMTEILVQRPLTIIDPKAAGRQHLWLGTSPSSGVIPQLPAPRE